MVVTVPNKENLPATAVLKAEAETDMWLLAGT